MSGNNVWRGDLLLALAETPEEEHDDVANAMGFSRRGQMNCTNPRWLRVISDRLDAAGFTAWPKMRASVHATAHLVFFALTWNRDDLRRFWGYVTGIEPVQQYHPPELVETQVMPVDVASVIGVSDDSPFML